MATDATKKETGEMPCTNDRCKSHNTGRSVIVFENGKGTLSFTCDKCGASQYARPGQQVHADWLEAMGKADRPPERTQPASVVPVASSSEGATDTAPAAAEVIDKTRAAFALDQL